LQGAQGNQVGVETEGRREQTQAMQRLKPLAIQHIGLVAGRETAGNVATDEATVDAPLLQHLEEGDPIDPRGLHGDGLDAVFDQPIGQSVQVGGVGAKGAHDLRVLGAGDADENLLSADIGAGGVRIDHRQAFHRADFPLWERTGS